MGKCVRGGVCRSRITHTGPVWQLCGSAHTRSVLQNIVQWSSVPAEVFAAVESLIQDQYDNYVVQHILGT
jgi:hypothetical protein